MKHKVCPRQPCCTGQSCPQSQVQYKLRPERLTRLGNLNVLRLPVRFLCWPGFNFDGAASILYSTRPILGLFYTVPGLSQAFFTPLAQFSVICQDVCMSICIPVYMFGCLDVWMSRCLYVCLCKCQGVYMSVYMSECLGVYMYVCV